MSKNHYVSGDHNLTCDVCSKKIKASQARKRWDGFLVCKDDFEERHPQDFVRAKQDRIVVPESRPIPPLVFNYCSVYTRVGIADLGTADCARADISLPDFSELP